MRQRTRACIASVLAIATLALGICGGCAKAPMAPSRRAAPVTDWMLGPFVKVPGANPCLLPQADSAFACPLDGQVRWEAAAVFNPAAVVRDGKVHLLYRAQAPDGSSRIGLASSEDGINFQRRPAPVLYPGRDAMQEFESKGGCEDPRIVEDDAGTYVLTYTAYDGKTARLAIATSRDLVHWEKRGLAFGRKHRDMWTKAAAIVCRLEGDRIVATKVNGKYWMYLRDSKLLAATSDDLLHWTIIEDDQGQPREIIGPRPGKFDSKLVEPGPPALLCDAGIWMIYNGVNAVPGGDASLPEATFAGGQIVMDPRDPTRILHRSDVPFIRPDQPFEITGQVANVCFLEGLVNFKGRWLLYYGTADSRIAVARAAPAVGARAPRR